MVTCLCRASERKKSGTALDLSGADNDSPSREALRACPCDHAGMGSHPCRGNSSASAR